MDTTLIIPQYQQSALTQACVASLRRHETTAWPTIVIDDGSDPAHRGLVREEDPQTRFVSVRHRGVTAAWNIGIALAETEFVALVNNDVLWSGPVVESLVQPLRDETALVTGVAWRDERWWPKTLQDTLPPRPLLAGWCWAFRRQTWRELHGFDESLELYFSDTDFQLRVLAQSRPLAPREESRGQKQRHESLMHHTHTTSGVDRLTSRGARGRLWGERLTPLLGCAVPLDHAGHRTARLLPDRREQWERDRRRFLEKWS